MRLKKLYINNDRVDDYGPLPVGDVLAQTKGYKPNFDYARLRIVTFERARSNSFYFACDVTKEELEQLGYKGGAK